MITVRLSARHSAHSRTSACRQGYKSKKRRRGWKERGRRLRRHLEPSASSWCTWGINDSKTTNCNQELRIKNKKHSDVQGNTSKTLHKHKIKTTAQITWGWRHLHLHSFGTCSNFKSEVKFQSYLWTSSLVQRDDEGVRRHWERKRVKVLNQIHEITRGEWNYRFRTRCTQCQQSPVQ